MHSSKQQEESMMKKQTMGALIAARRKELGMTQLELAQKMGVTDKAVSKWERDLSCPDVNSLPKLAEIFGISVDELMRIEEKPEQKPVGELPRTICRAVALAMGVATVVLSILKQVDLYSAVGMLGVGLTALAVLSFLERD